MSAAVIAAGGSGVLATLAAGQLRDLFGRREHWARRRSPAGTISRLGALAGRLPGPAAPRDLADRLAAAGHSGPGLARDVMALKCALAVIAGAIALAGGEAALGPRLARLTTVLAPVAGFVAIDLVLWRRTRRRAAVMRRELPALLDRVRMALDAGQTPTAALERATRSASGQLAAELRAMLARIELGERRGDSLELLRRRCPAPGVRALAAALERSARHGSGLSRTLQALADGARGERAQRIQDRAQRAAPQIQLVVALGLVPAALLLLGAGMVARG